MKKITYGALIIFLLMSIFLSYKKAHSEELLSSNEVQRYSACLNILGIN